MRWTRPASSRSHSWPATGPRNQVEGKDLLDAAAVGIDREGDAVVDESQVGERSPLEEFAGGKPSQPVEQQPAIPMRVAIRGKELVPCLGVAGVITKQRERGLPLVPALLLGLSLRLRLRLSLSLSLSLNLALRLKRLTGGHRGPPPPLDSIHRHAQ